MVGAERNYSDDLRAGLATTLALLGAHGATRIVGSTATGFNWANRIVSTVLRRANQDHTGHLWASLGDLLPLLAEAAPDEFLDAVRSGLLGADPLLRTMFMDAARQVSFLGPHRHTRIYCGHLKRVHGHRIISGKLLTISRGLPTWIPILEATIATAR